MLDLPTFFYIKVHHKISFNCEIYFLDTNFKIAFLGFLQLYKSSRFFKRINPVTRQKMSENKPLPEHKNEIHDDLVDKNLISYWKQLRKKPNIIGIVNFLDSALY